MNAILIKLLGIKGAWKFIFEFLISMMKAQKLKISGPEKLEEVIAVLLDRYGKGVEICGKLLPLITNAAKAVKELYVGVCEVFGFER